MAKSKPKFRSLFSISVFILLCYVISGILFFRYGEAWWQQIVIIIFFPLGSVLLFRLLWDLKTIEFSKNRVMVRWPVRFQEKSIPLSEIRQWREEKVKTFNTLFREVIIEYGRKKLRMSNQEFTEYDKAVGYLRKKAGKKEIKS